MQLEQAIEVNNYYEIIAEVPGHIGQRSVVDREARPPKVSSLHFVFEDWGGDELLTSYPIYLVKDSLAEAFLEQRFSGFELASVDVERGKQILAFKPSLELPKFLWLRVTGDHKGADFFMTSNRYLGVSEGGLMAIKETRPRTLVHRIYHEGDNSGKWV
ncbi:hypothetical protein OJ996_25520 [Luteolibacter sp. GHJ8]|uniref:Uncharacterized protein n=1 Tax=Luteolibacter rhizosphaerae TaxID=2989719 RepID=A0ABT3GBH5_9BACT|nr:hypothetical protein [Luteolibacter rhizosphaerae]